MRNRSTLLIGLCVAFGSGQGCKGGERSPEKAIAMSESRGNNKVELGPTKLRYFEGANVLELTVELASDSNGGFYIVYIPTANTWLREMPDWCRYRRDEVLAKIKSLVKRERIKWVEEE